MTKCSWCGMGSYQAGTTTEYLCGSSVGCAHQTRSPACKEIQRLRTKITQISDALGAIVIDEGEDAGVILLSWDSPTHYDAKLKCEVYEYENFSPLGDALVALAKMVHTHEADSGPGTV